MVGRYMNFFAWFIRSILVHGFIIALLHISLVHYLIIQISNFFEFDVNLINKKFVGTFWKSNISIQR